MGRRKDFTTTPVFNILQHDPTCLIAYTRLFTRQMHADLSQSQKPVPFHKERLGRQTYCYTTYRRLYVWEYENWRVYVHNDLGAALEVLPNLTPDETLLIARTYYKSISQKG